MTQRTATNALAVRDLPFIGKFSLRCRTADRLALAAALELELPGRIGGLTNTGKRRALRLGPDEWMLYCEASDRAAVTLACEKIYDSAPHSLVDVSHREVGIEISGPEAEALLNTGCPRNLDEIKPGQGTRTLFDAATVVLVREAPDRFSMHVWRSFFPHVRGLLAAAEREFAAGL